MVPHQADSEIRMHTAAPAFGHEPSLLITDTRGETVAFLLHSRHGPKTHGNGASFGVQNSADHDVKAPGLRFVDGLARIGSIVSRGRGRELGTRVHGGNR